MENALIMNTKILINANHHIKEKGKRYVIMIVIANLNVNVDGNQKECYQRKQKKNNSKNILKKLFNYLFFGEQGLELDDPKSNCDSISS